MVLEATWNIGAASAIPAMTFVLWLLALWRNKPKTESTAEMATKGVVFEQGVGRLSRYSNKDLDAVQAPKEAHEYFKTVRTYEAFRKGGQCPESERLPRAVKRTYNLNVQQLSLAESEVAYGNMRVPRLRLLKTVKIALLAGTSLSAKLPTVLLLMTFSGLTVTMTTVVGDFAGEFWYETLVMLQVQINDLIKSLQTAVTMLLSFYALNRVAWFWEIMQGGWSCMGRIQDFGLVVGPALGYSEEELRAKYKIYRYLTLSFFFCFQSITPAFKFVGYDPLVTCGLLTKAEVSVISSAHHAPRTIVEAWQSAWIQEHVRDSATRLQLLKSLCDVRAITGRVIDLMDQRAPVSFESLLYICVYAFCFLLPFGHSAQNEEQRQKASMCIWLLARELSHGATIAFHLSLVHLLYHLQAPFDSIGLPLDSLNPMAIMLITERRLRDYLTVGAAPDSSAKPTLLESREDKSNNLVFL